MRTSRRAAVAARVPVVLVPDDPEVLGTTRSLARAAGRRLSSGWQLPATPWDLHPHGVVVSGSLTATSRTDELVDAVVRGVGAIVAVPTGLPRPVRLIDALQRITPVVDGDGCAVLRLDTTQLELLIELARGASTREASETAHVSVRTAHRRLADAREVLGAGSTNAAASAVRDALRFWAP